MKMTFIGDIHASYEALRHIDTKTQGVNCFLGDFNLFGYEQWFDRNDNPQSIKLKSRHWFIDGNHDNFKVLDMTQERPYQVAENIFHIPRGFVSGSVLFIGGAYSIDKTDRIWGVDWYPQEECSWMEMGNILTINKKIEVIVTHGVPSKSDNALMPYRSLDSSTNKFFDEVLQTFKPSLWIHGHHHKSLKYKIGDTQFRSLGCNERFRVDVPLNEEDWKV